ncbi:nucleotidyltransferase domain-containing protein [Sinorhizobium sp. GL28]|uniref:nucleotidyltransferase domain-containing protein n=1 Tax=Sinorhizobium sp. GL28 TaxID=1358418 RepID=UPI000B0FFE38|nr:nucleotidyltransferase domain-containing protein [Sinorhizobium sp. GL28]
MGLRAIAPNMAPDVVTNIDRRLEAIRGQNNVAIPIAIESGSRAWGFPSPDSDYDCRFLFVRRLEDYLSPWVKRDVIETPLEGVFDVNGWDLGKALKLMLKGNAVILEWLTSPIVYCGSASFRTHFLDLAHRYASRDLIGLHYLHLGERQRKTYFGDTQNVAQKKVFYALRPAAALRWLRGRPDLAVPPMHFPTLIAEIDPPSGVREIVDDLLLRKASSRELGFAAVPRPILDFIDNEFLLAQSAFGGGRIHAPAKAHADAETFFRETVLRFAEGAQA